jgi:hypothetical protein
VLFCSHFNVIYTLNNKKKSVENLILVDARGIATSMYQLDSTEFSLRFVSSLQNATIGYFSESKLICQNQQPILIARVVLATSNATSIQIEIFQQNNSKQWLFTLMGTAEVALGLALGNVLSVSIVPSSVNISQSNIDVTFFFFEFDSRSSVSLYFYCFFFFFIIYYILKFFFIF